MKWLEAEADRLEKEYIENDDPNKTVNHSFIEGFNYALVNLQAIEELELNDNQKIVLEWLKSETILTREAPIYKYIKILLLEVLKTQPYQQNIMDNDY